MWIPYQKHCGQNGVISDEELRAELQRRKEGQGQGGCDGDGLWAPAGAWSIKASRPSPPSGPPVQQPRTGTQPRR